MRVHQLVSVFAVAILFVVLAHPAAAERRLALVIGNSAYDVQPLDNPVNDARLMADTLEEVGFDVTHVEDLDQRAMERAVVDFSRDLRAAGEDAVGLVYYAGHAIQSGGENYLIPTDAELRDKLDLRIQTLDASTIMASLESAGNRLNMVFLDACRDNPFKGLSRSSGRGLAKLDAPSGTLIAYSTAPGDIATDGSGRNSPYTAALARAIREPGLPVEQALKRVRIDVMERTGNRQTPWETSSLTGDFFFVKKPPEPEPTNQTANLNPPAADPTVEIEYWKAVAATNDEQSYRNYLSRYPDGLFADLANSRLEAIGLRRTEAERKAAHEKDIAFFRTIQANESVEGYESYLSRYPDGFFVDLARQRVEALKAARTAAVDREAEPRSSSGMNGEMMLWQSVKDARTEAELQAYLGQYPDGKFAGVAKARIAALNDPAAAPPPGNAIDGKWKLDWHLDEGPFYPGVSFCSANERVTGTIKVVDGEFDEKLTSSGGSYIRLRGKMSERSARLKVRISGWPQWARATLESRGAELVGNNSGFSGTYCIGTITMTRAE